MDPNITAGMLECQRQNKTSLTSYFHTAVAFCNKTSECYKSFNFDILQDKVGVAVRVQCVHNASHVSIPQLPSCNLKSVQISNTGICECGSGTSTDCFEAWPPPRQIYLRIIMGVTIAFAVFGLCESLVTMYNIHMRGVGMSMMSKRPRARKLKTMWNVILFYIGAICWEAFNFFDVFIAWLVGILICCAMVGSAMSALLTVKYLLILLASQDTAGKDKVLQVVVHRSNTMASMCMLFCLLATLIFVALNGATSVALANMILSGLNLILILCIVSLLQYASRSLRKQLKRLGIDLNNPSQQSDKEGIKKFKEIIHFCGRMSLLLLLSVVAFLATALSSVPAVGMSHAQIEALFYIPQSIAKCTLVCAMRILTQTMTPQKRNSKTVPTEKTGSDESSVGTLLG